MANRKNRAPADKNVANKSSEIDNARSSENKPNQNSPAPEPLIPNPPQANLAALIGSGILMVGWMVFLVVVALR